MAPAGCFYAASCRLYARRAIHGPGGLFLRGFVPPSRPPGHPWPLPAVFMRHLAAFTPTLLSIVREPLVN